MCKFPAVSHLLIPEKLSSQGRLVAWFLADGGPLLDTGGITRPTTRDQKKENEIIPFGLVDSYSVKPTA